MWYFGEEAKTIEELVESPIRGITTEKLINAINTGSDFIIHNILTTYQKRVINPNYTDADGNTFFHMAARNPYFPKSGYQLLYQLGCPLDEKNCKGDTPLQCTSQEWQHDAINRLVFQKQQAENIRRQAEQKDFDLRIDKEVANNHGLYPGIYITSDLHLFYGSKSIDQSKFCQIPDKWDELDKEDHQKVTLHQRLAMIEPFSVCGAQNINDFILGNQASNDNNRNWVVANIGFVVSDKPHPKSTGQPNKGVHKRIFISVPIDDPIFLIYRSPNQHQHSEETLYEYLKDGNNIRRIISLLSEKLKFCCRTFKGHKIYAVILDINSSRNMCGGCQEKTYEMQTGRDKASSFLHLLETILEKDFQYVLPREKLFPHNILLPKSLRLYFATRVSSYFPCGQILTPKQKLSETSVYTYKQIDCDEKNPFSSKDSVFRNIKLFKNSVILHTDNGSWKKYNFYEKGDYGKVAASGTTFFSVPRQSVFAVTNSDTCPATKVSPKVTFQ